MRIEINDKLFKDIKSYCDLNEIGSPTKYINDLLKKSFMIEKYGNRPGVYTVPSEPIFPPSDVKEFAPVFNEKNGTINDFEKPEVEIDENFNYKEIELNKALKDDVFNKELSDETPVVVEKPKKRRKLN